MILFQSVHLEQYLAVAVENWATVGDGAFCRRDLHARDSWSPVGKSAGSPARSNAPGALTNTTNWRDLLFPSGLSQLRTHRAASKLPSDAAAAAVLKASITEAANFDQAKISQALQALRARYKPQTQEATRYEEGGFEYRVVRGMLFRRRIRGGLADKASARQEPPK